MLTLSVNPSATISISSFSMWRNFLGSFSSAAQYDIRSRAVSRVCLLEETKIRVGFVGECSMMAA